MNKDDLINFNIKKKWANARISFLEEQIKTVGRLNSILSDMPKGSKIVYDSEAESVVKLLDQIRDLKRTIEKDTSEAENKLMQQLELLEDKYGLLLYHHYIVGDSMKYIAKEIIHNEVKYTYKLRDKALEEFDKKNEKREKKG